MAIPGVGLSIAAGPIVAALAGAAAGGAAGGMTGGLIGMGIQEYEAKRYEGKIKDGNILISVQTEDGTLSSARTQRHSCSAGQEAVFVVKSVPYGVRHNSARSVEAMPLGLQMHGEIQGQIGKSGPQRRVWSASIVME
jgi:hypothetical protein